MIAAEDARFYQHHGFDWHQIEMGPPRTIWKATAPARFHPHAATREKFFGTGRSILRKGAEATLVPVAEIVFGKRRILALYLNVVEWGPGISGANQRAVTTTKPPPAISAANRPPASLPFCRRH